MNEQEVEIINSLTKTEKIKIFLKNNIKLFIIFIILILLLIFGYLSFIEFSKTKKEKISNLYKNTIIAFTENNKLETKNKLIDVINEKDKTYSPLALYFLIENELLGTRNEVNKYFDIIIYEISLEKTIKDLNIYKKALYNSNFESEEILLEIIEPLIKSESLWRAHALYLMGEYYYSKSKKQKSKEFFNRIVSLNEANKDIRLEAQKRLQRDFSD